MKPQDVIKQLIGDCSGYDPVDTFNFNFYEPTKFPGADLAAIDLEKGIVVVQYMDNSEDEPMLQKEDIFSIKATLEPYEEPDDQENS